MEIKIRVPLSLHKLTDNKTELECEGDTVEELLYNMNNHYPGIGVILWNEEGLINHPFSLFLNGRTIKSIKKEKILLKEGDEILILQLVAGG